MGKEKTNLTPIKNSFIIALYDTHFHTLMGVALHLTQNEIDAEELIAATFAKVCQWQLERIEKISGWDDASTFTYLSNTLANTHIDIHRKKNSRNRIEKYFDGNNELRFENSPESVFIGDENIRIIRKAYYDVLAKESKIVRVAFYLRTQRGMKNKDIAHRLRLSANTLGTKFRRLRIKIKEKLG